VIVADADEAGRVVADAVCRLLAERPDAVLGLATGSSPLPSYRELVRRHEAGQVSFRRARAFLLDEYVGLPPGHPQAYRSVIERELTGALDIPPAAVRGPDGGASDLVAECLAYETAIAAAGGIDLQILGIGADGHIGFNEPSSSLGSRTRLKTLTARTRRDNARFFAASEEVPHHAITQGIGTILEARHFVLVATGASKAEAIALAVEGPVTAMAPASALQLHPHASVVVDEAVAGRLALSDYYREAHAGKPPWQGSDAEVGAPPAGGAVPSPAVSLPISVLDLSPVPSGASGRDAVRNTLDLARAAERLGYARYWLAEHHNTPGMACPAPDVMIGHVADATSRIRVGSGGVMLPNHSPLRVAEAFRVLEALHPGRVDLGIGRAPGTDAMSAVALRRGGIGVDDLVAGLAELFAFAGDGFPEDHPFHEVAAEPRDVPLPPVWILGSSDYGAQVAAGLGLGYAFARHLNPRGAAAAMRAYRERFTPSARRSAPRSILAVSAICAETADRAEELAWSMALGVIRMRTGRPSTLPTPEEARTHRYTEPERDHLRRYRRAQVVGDPAGVRDELTALLDQTGADELMVLTMVHDHAARLRSYELIAEALGPARAVAPAA
jgi:glucosamine-6-phosphate isomerase